MEAQARAVQQIRRVIASIERLRGFVRNFTNDLAGFRPLQECVNTLVRRNTCGRCEARRPPFCRNVCRAIASACYSPFNDALEDQLELLWEVVRRILDAATDALGDLNQNRGILRVDRLTIVSGCAVFSSEESELESGRERERKGRARGGERERRVFYVAYKKL